MRGEITSAKFGVCGEGLIYKLSSLVLGPSSSIPTNPFMIHNCLKWFKFYKCLFGALCVSGTNLEDIERSNTNLLSISLAKDSMFHAGNPEQFKIRKPQFKAKSNRRSSGVTGVSKQSLTVILGRLNNLTVVSFPHLQNVEL